MMPTTTQAPAVATAGMVPPGASGVADYGRLLHDALRRRGLTVDERWTVNVGATARDAGRATVEFLRRARQIPAGSVVLWHYSSFAYGVRGVPFPGVAFGLVARRRGLVVVTLLHELAYPWGRRGWRGLVQAVTQRAALGCVLVGSDAVIVTTERRAEWVGRLPRPLRRPVTELPVFSTLGEPESTPAVGDGQGVVGVVSYGSDSVDPALLLGAIGEIPATVVRRVVLLGAPGPGSKAADAWRSAAERLGVAGRVELTGVVPPGELSRALTACDVLLLPDPDGPTARKTTLAAALAHGVPTVALAGPEQWEDLLTHGAIDVAPQRQRELATALQRLLESPCRRQELGARGRAFYLSRMRLDVVADGVVRVLDEASAGRGGGP